MDPIVGGQLPKRNELCPCGSKRKYSKCHGNSAKQGIAKRKAMEVATVVYREEMDRLTSISEGEQDE